MLFRMLVGAGLFVSGYYLGKQIGRTESVREDLERARAARPDDHRAERDAGNREAGNREA
jgi:hypothetical protein